MPQWDQDALTEQQRKWFASVREGLVRETGRDLAQWVELARACPEIKHRARLAWMKQTYGLGQNRASIILAEAFPSAPPIAGTEADPLWSDPAARAVFDAVERLATALEGVTTGRRKGFTAFSRRYQFAALRPVKGGVRLGLATPADADARLRPAEREGWSERLSAVTGLARPEEVDAGLEALLRQAWAAS
jgi:hypothetical protein